MCYTSFQILGYCLFRRNKDSLRHAVTVLTNNSFTGGHKMRKKQLFALLMASALSVGMAPTAAFAAADTAVETASEEASGELDAADTETPAEDPAETPADETPAEDPAAEDPAETPADETPAEETPGAEETDAQAAEADGATIIVGDSTTSYTTLAEAFAAVADSTDTSAPATQVKVQGTIEIDATVDVPANKNIQLVAVGEATIMRAAGFT